MEEEVRERAFKNILILEAIRRKGPLSKTDISKLTGINPVTISNYIERFLERNLVLKKELDISRGGRRPLLLDLNPQAGYAIGVGINLFGVVGVVTDLEGKIVYSTKFEAERVSFKDVENFIEKIIEKIIEDNFQIKEKIKGIGIGIGGVIDKEQGLIKWPEKKNQEYVYVPVPISLKSMERKWNLPVLIENDATAACFAEYWLGLPFGIKNVIYMFSGVGVGFILNGELYTGTTGCAGEVSVYNSLEDNLFNCEFANNCFIKRWEKDLGILEEVKKRCYKKRIKYLGEKKVEDLTLREVFELAKEESLIQEVLEEAGKRLGIKIAFLVNLLNPEIVVIGGGIEYAGEIFINSVRTTVKAWTFEEINRPLKIVPSFLGEESVALGGASLVVRKVFSKL